MYIHFISSTNNGDNVTRQYNYISFQEAEEIDNLKYTTINRHKICVLHVIIYYMYMFSKEKQLNTEHGVYLIDISIFLVLIHQTWKSFSRDNINPLAKRKRDLILNIRRKIFRDVYGFLRHRKPRLLMYFEGALWLERMYSLVHVNAMHLMDLPCSTIIQLKILTTFRILLHTLMNPWKHLPMADERKSISGSVLKG